MFYLTSGDTGVLSCNHFNYSPPKFLLDFLLAGFPFIDILTPATPGVIGKETPYGKTQTFNTG